MRMNKTMRSEIVQAALDHQIGKEIEHAHKRLEQCAEAAYTAILTDQNIAEQVAQGNEKLFNRQACYWVGYEQRRERLSFPAPLLVPCTGADSWDRVFSYVHKDLEALDQWDEQRRAVGKLKDKRKKLKQELEALVNSITTTKKLAEVFPELTQFIPTDETPKQLPAVRREELALALGIKE